MSNLVMIKLIDFLPSNLRINWKEKIVPMRRPVATGGGGTGGPCPPPPVNCQCPPPSILPEISIFIHLLNINFVVPPRSQAVPPRSQSPSYGPAHALRSVVRTMAISPCRNTAKLRNNCKIVLQHIFDILLHIIIILRKRCAWLNSLIYLLVIIVCSM